MKTKRKRKKLSSLNSTLKLRIMIKTITNQKTIPHLNGSIININPLIEIIEILLRVV
jgi:hypothetical protein